MGVILGVRFKPAYWITRPLGPKLLSVIFLLVPDSIISPEFRSSSWR